MFLKRLEIQGFKSFAERIEIEFGPGITAIVGPNGCGKSNITDAVQWVLGEQNARALRGYKMDDVIFAGTVRRRPHGMAEATLILDNTCKTLPLDYQEVAITRRVYRSGEGEYFINKTPCRLRDIQELFLSCGIARAAFSVVAQGQIEEFIAQRPEERRICLEEAAGINRYRQRKADAIIKLDETENVLERLHDLLGELGRQLAPLEEQARVANLYSEHQNSLKQLEGRLVNSQQARLAAKKLVLGNTLTNLQSGTDLMRQQAAFVESELNSQEGGLNFRKERIVSCELECSQVLQQLQDLNILSARVEEKYAAVRSRAAELEVRLKVIEQKDGEIGSEMRQLAGQHAERLEQRARADQDHAALEFRLEDWEKKKQQVNRDWEENNGELFEVLHKKTLLAGQVKELLGRKEASGRQQVNLRLKASANEERIARLREQAEEVNLLLQSKAALLGQAAGELELARQQAAAAGEEQNRLALPLKKQLLDTERYQTRLQMLQEAEKNLDGYQKGVRAIIQARSKGELFCEGILGLVEEILAIDAKYETALYTALGQASHYFVCTAPEVAQRALSFLKANDIGRASFLPLTALQRWLEKEHRPSYFPSQGILGRGSELVVCQEIFKNVAEFLLGRTFFASGLRDARAFAELNYYRVRVVTLEGDLIQPGGLITGGREGRPVQLGLKRKQELVQLSENLDQGRQALEELEKRQSRLSSEQALLESRIRELEASKRSLENERGALEHSISSLARECQQLSEFNRSFVLESSVENYRWGDLDQEIAGSEAGLAEVGEDEPRLEEQRLRIERDRKECDEQIRSLSGLLSDSKVRLVSIDQEIKYLEQKTQQFGNLVAEQQQERAQVKSGLDDLLGEAAALEQQRQDHSLNRKQLRQKKERLDADMSFRSRQYDAKERCYRVKEKRFLKMRQLCWNREQKIRSLELQLQHLEEQLEEIGSRALELGVELEQEQAVELDRQAESRMKEQVADLREKLGGFGDVNFTAPAEHAAMQERHGFLRQQQDDLVAGRAALLDLIKEMDQIVVSRFRQLFEAVRHNFEEVCSVLFDGGKAELFLTDPAQPMLTGIDVRVLPRGKKPRHLSLLSGGEKALAGICFLFALLRARPSPFYILDEIEAYLDESNLARFTDFLSTMALHSQIILISHRPRTMQVADVLYGVTMEEPGVSKLVSVELVEHSSTGA